MFNLDIGILSLLAKLYINIFFRRVDANGNLIDRNSPEYGKDIKEPYINDIPRLDANASINAWPHVVKNGGTATVVWSSVLNPNAKDFIAYYCPVYDDPSHHLDYVTVNQCPTWKQGYGHITVTVYNMRTTCVFKYYRAGHAYSQLAGISNEISFSDGGPCSSTSRS